MNRRRARGVTLLEILVVLAIVALMSAVIAVAVIAYLDKAKKETTRQSAVNLRSAVMLHRVDRGDECPSAAKLVETGALDAMSKTKDAWETPFTIECDEQGRVTVASAGPDKKLGTDDDIRVPPPTQTN